MPNDEHIQAFLDRVKALRSEGTWKARRSHLKQFDQWLQEHGYEAVELEARQLDQFFTHERAKGLAPKTMGGRYESVRLLYEKLAGLYDELEETPFKHLERREYVQPTTRKHNEADISYITPEEKEALCENVPAPKVRNELLIRLLWQTGMRKQEISDTKLEDVDRDERRITVYTQKTGDERTVFYQPSLDLLLDQWIDGGYRDAYTVAEESPYLFVTRKSEQFKFNRVNEVVRQAADKAEIQEEMYEDANGNPRYRITAHALRHGFAVQSLKNDMPINVLSDLMGHENLETTKKYLQLVDDDLAEAARRFGAGSEELAE